MAGTAYNQFFNGTIDEVRVWNRTMGVAEMKQHYYSNLHKYDNGKWALFVNETNLSRSTYQYQSSASDSEGNSNNTERRTITIGNAIPPDFTNIVLNSTNATNLTSENLTVYFTPNTDGDKDQVFNITDWRKNASSIAVLNMPFETNYSGVQGNVRDYTTYENNGTLGNSTTTTQPTWITTGIGGGAYSFNGAINEQFISIPDDNTLDVTGAISVEAWVYKDADKNWAGIVTKGSGAVEGDAGASSYLLREDDNQAAQFQISDSGDTRYSATTVSKLSTGGWYHLVGVYNTTHVLIYLNGTLTVGDAFTGSVRASTADVMIGHDFYYVVRGFAGRIDNIRVYNHSLSTAQVLANYEAGADNHSVQTITSQETTKGENWTVALTPTDNIDDGNTSISNYVIIENSAPDHVNLSSPEAGNTTTDRTPTLTWLDGVDDDEDNLSYSLLVDNDEDFSSPAIEIETSSTTYTPTTDLDLDIMYYWKVNATDGEAGSAYSDVWNFTVNSYVSVSLINNTVDFGSMIRSTTDNTTDDSPYPFVVENDGNSLINISINATPLFDSVAMGSNYQFRIDNHTEAGSFNWTTSITTWTNMLTSQVVAIDALKYDDASDTAQCEILVDVPSDEIAGGKASNVLFEAGLAE